MKTALSPTACICQSCAVMALRFVPPQLQNCRCWTVGRRKISTAGHVHFRASAKSTKTPEPRQRNDVPILLLAGEYDPATPSNWAEDLARHKKSSQLVVFRGIGHDVIDATKCGRDVVADFLENPDDKIKTPCVAELPGTAVLSSLPDDNSGSLMSASVRPAMLDR